MLHHMLGWYHLIPHSSIFYQQIYLYQYVVSLKVLKLSLLKFCFCVGLSFILVVKQCFKMGSFFF